MLNGFPVDDFNRPLLQIDRSTRALIFDIDGTLVDTIPIHFETWKEVLRELNGYELSWQNFRKVLGYGKLEIIQKLSTFVGKELDYQLYKEVQEEKYADAVRRALPIQPVVDLLKKNFHRLPVCLATAESRRIAELNIGVLKIDGLYSCLLTADDVKHRKPHPEIYLKAAEILDVTPLLCHVFEDSEAGILAARGARMKVTDVSAFSPSYRSGNLLRA